MNGDVSKDLVFAQPRQESKYSESGTSPRDWTVAEVEEVMWRIRASGGTDSTPVKFSYRHEDSIRALHVEAFPVEVPRRRPAPACKACDDRGVLEGTGGKPCPVCRRRDDERQWWYRPAQVLGTLIALPLVLAALVAAWDVLVGVLFRL